jgi:uncharacterized membrane protein
MVLWGLIVGAVIGLSAQGMVGFLPGALLGAAAGWALRAAVRAEVAGLAAKRDAPAPDGVAAERAPARRYDWEEPPQAAPVDLPASDRRPPGRPQPVAAAERPAPRSIAAPEPVHHEPPAPDFFERARAWLFGGNTIVRAGLVVLFVGLAFLARWAAGAGLLPIEARLALVAAAGVALLVIGFSRRKARPGFALALQGGGVAVLYLTIFAAAVLYPVIAVPAAFALMAGVCAGAVALALLQNSQSLAAAAFAGGYVVPLLLGGEGGPVAAMFGYHALLNFAVLALAWKKAWRSINLIGFVATFGIAAFWGGFSYKPADFTVAESFLLLSVAVYLAIAILYARNSDSRSGRFVDSSLLFGVGLVGFGLQAGLVEPYEYGAAFSALGFAAVYLVLATAVMRRGGEAYRVLAETMLAIGVGFATLAVPLGLGARWTGSAWALEGAGAFWVGMRQARWIPRAFGLALQVVAALLFLGMANAGPQATALLNPAFLTGLLAAAPVLLTAWWLRRDLPHSGSRQATEYAAFERGLGKPAFLLGFLIWSLALVAEVGRSLPPAEAGLPSLPVFAPRVQVLIDLFALVASAWIADRVGRLWRWPVARWPGRVTLLVLIFAWMTLAALGGLSLTHPGWIVWIAAGAIHLHLLALNDRDEAAGQGARNLQRVCHIGGVWLAALLLADLLRLGVDKADLWGTSWAGVILLVAGAAVLGALTLWTGMAARRPAEQRGWPLNLHLAAYQAWAALPIAAAVYLGSLAAAVGAEGAAKPLPYLPLVNPLELSLALSLGVLVLWRRSLMAVVPPHPGAGWLSRRPAWLALAALGFVEINMLWLRVAHHFLGVDWAPEALLGSTVVESGVTILWTLLALGLMLFARRRAERPTWIAGAALLVVVIVKLFFVDLSHASGGARIVTFIVVGVLMLVVGYFAPLPPKPAAASEETPA